MLGTAEELSFYPIYWDAWYITLQPEIKYICILTNPDSYKGEKDFDERPLRCVFEGVDEQFKAIDGQRHQRQCCRLCANLR